MRIGEVKLSKKPIPGLKEECQSWIHYWGNGGGDYSTEACITSALDELNSDIPTDISDTIYGSICGYSKSGFEASLLAMDIVNEKHSQLEITKTGGYNMKLVNLIIRDFRHEGLEKSGVEKFLWR